MFSQGFLDNLEERLVRLKVGKCVSSDLEVEAAAAIAGLRAELAAANKRMSKLDFERTAAELERDAFFAKLSALRVRRPIIYSPDAQAMSDRVKAAEAERDALRAELAALRVGLDTKHQQYVEANEARIDANDALGNIRGLLWDVDEELAGGGHLRDGRLRRRVHSAIKNIGKLLENGEQYE